MPAAAMVPSSEILDFYAAADILNFYAASDILDFYAASDEELQIFFRSPKDPPKI
jgi:hypothetical protein